MLSPKKLVPPRLLLSIRLRLDYQSLEYTPRSLRKQGSLSGLSSILGRSSPSFLPFGVFRVFRGYSRGGTTEYTEYTELPEGLDRPDRLGRLLTLPRGHSVVARDLPRPAARSHALPVRCLLHQ